MTVVWILHFLHQRTRTSDCATHLILIHITYGHLNYHLLSNIAVLCCVWNNDTVRVSTNVTFFQSNITHGTTNNSAKVTNSHSNNVQEQSKQTTRQTQVTWPFVSESTSHFHPLFVLIMVWTKWSFSPTPLLTHTLRVEVDCHILFFIWMSFTAKTNICTRRHPRLGLRPLARLYSSYLLRLRISVHLF